MVHKMEKKVTVEFNLPMTEDEVAKLMNLEKKEEKKPEKETDVMDDYDESMDEFMDSLSSTNKDAPKSAKTNDEMRALG